MKAIIVAAIMSAAPGIASAQWMYQESGGAFDGNALHLGAVSAGPYGFALRCRTADTLEMVFLTPELVDTDTAELMALTFPKILFRVDDLEPFEIEAIAHSQEGLLSLTGEAPPEVLDQVAGANRRIAVAVRVLDEVYHETDFTARGSTAAANSVRSGCGF